MLEKSEGIVRRLFDEVWSEGRLDSLDALMTNDIVCHDPLDPTKGLEAYKQTVKKYRAAFPDLRFEIDELFSAADRVVVRFRGIGTHRGPLESLPATGRQVSATGISIARFAGDRICETFDSWDALGLMQQLGAVTLPGKAAAAGA